MDVLWYWTSRGGGKCESPGMLHRCLVDVVENTVYHVEQCGGMACLPKWGNIELLIVDCRPQLACLLYHHPYAPICHFSNTNLYSGVWYHLHKSKFIQHSCVLHNHYSLWLSRCLTHSSNHNAQSFNILSCYCVLHFTHAYFFQVPNLLW